ncbi:hypothetical protein [Kitasatospora sp. NPDC056731]|uniref:hypothetical protein n=1 Tax=Kitasatospora sp. NPDC056731 TaxID=3155422 RepID=UPI003440E528
MTVHTFRLAFSQITCSGCGINRIRGIECADCGQRPEPWEVNTASLARRQAAVRARAMLSRSVSLPTSGCMDAVEFLHAGIFARLGAWMEGFLQAAAATAEGSMQGAQDLEKGVSEFVELRATVLGADDRRPLRALVTVLRLLAGELESMVDTYLAALIAASPLQAQDLARAAQRHLDRTAALAGRAAAIADTMEAMTSQRDIAQIQADLLTRALQAYQVPDLLALDTAGRDALQQLVSSRGVAGSGILFAVHDLQTRSVFDSDQFHDVLRRAYLVFRSNPTVLRTLATTPSFEEDFKRAVWELFDGSMEAAHAIDNAVHSRQAGRALLGIAAALVEGPGQVMATVLLLACGRKSAAYANLRHANATDLVSTAQQEPALQGLLDGLDSDLRTGRAHALVRYEQDFAVIERKSKTLQVAWADVLDRVFQGHESVLACQLALLQALGELGFTSFAVNGLWRSLGLTAEQVAITVLGTMNCRDVTITPRGKQWHIEAQVGSGTPLPMLVAMLQPTMPGDLEALVLTAHQTDGIHVLAGPVAPWRELSDAPEGSDAHQVAFLRAQLSWTYDGTPWLPTSLVRSWMAGQAAKALDTTPAMAVSQLRMLRELAVLAGDDALIWTLSGAIRYTRLGSDSDAAAELTQLAAWGSAPVTGPTWWQTYNSTLR